MFALSSDVSASVVVFLVALPLCVGVAVASGVPAELGLVTGIVGGLVTGLLPGSSLQVSGPAAGLTVLVAEAVRSYGLAALGLIVVATGLLQLLLGVLRLGRWFRAISLSVVEGMLAGIGLVIIAGQLFAMADRPAPPTGPDKLLGLPALAAAVIASPGARTAFCLGAGVIAVIVAWPYLPEVVRTVPGALVGVGLAVVATQMLDLPVETVKISGILEAVTTPDFTLLPSLPALFLVGTITAFTLIASAESLFSAAAVDRLHNGPRTDFDKELIAQGAGNTVSGLLGALPLTAVIVRSSANVRAGARTKVSRVLHGVWLLLFVMLLPGVLAMIPVAALAGVLVHAGVKLLPVKQFVPLWRRHRGEALVLLATALGVLGVGMFEGVLIGLGLSVVKTAWDTSRVKIETVGIRPDELTVKISGNATFLNLPRLLDALEALPSGCPIRLDMTDLRHRDHACTMALLSWVERRDGQDVTLVQLTPSL
ncbi:MFS superfamily sulfate permease-like transporter [Streptomyces sp. CG 926]|uniref:SulP family inorganic anion transporter n=1 Tax=Streptomyces sp. CG 926 TaxID=1882405 RepID=UPI000D6D87AE|nr:SulP family inorganic anion transporter [Streptomyces sp. CG 926]PWK65090.1 MFS superfamily sulfate permease-like transporter [Streptomyces sp. CG 926]